VATLPTNGARGLLTAGTSQSTTRRVTKYPRSRSPLTDWASHPEYDTFIADTRKNGSTFHQIAFGSRPLRRFRDGGSGVRSVPRLKKLLRSRTEARFAAQVDNERSRAAIEPLPVRCLERAGLRPADSWTWSRPARSVPLARHGPPDRPDRSRHAREMASDRRPHIGKFRPDGRRRSRVRVWPARLQERFAHLKRQVLSPTR